MTKPYLKFPQKRLSFAPKLVSRRNPALRMAAYRSDGGDPDDGNEKENELLEKIKSTIASEIRSKDYKNGTEIQNAITETLKGMNLEALRKYESDKEAMEQNIANLAASFKKIEEVGSEKRNKTVKTTPIKELLEKRMKDIEKVMKGKKGTVELNVRAAVIMNMDSAIEEPNDMPDDIIESFSVDSFQKKRQPKEYIFEIASRRTVPELTEYKTWLEEGDSEGNFAIVAEGAVKPMMSKNLVRNVSKYQKVAAKRVYTEEFAKFRKEAYRILEDLFNDQLIRDYSGLLTTALLTKAATYVGTALDGQYDEPTDYHAIGAVAAQEESLEFMPDLLILNPQDKWRIGLSQDKNGAFYVNIPVYNPSGTVTMMGFRVFTSSRMPVGQAILGESGLYKIEDEAIQVRLGYGIDVTKDGEGNVTDVTSDVDTNRFRIIAETFFHNYISTMATGSFVKFTFADVKEALLKPAV